MSEFEKVTTGLGEECGVFGAYDMDGGDVAPSVYYGLFALQHRGQESCGIAVTDTYGERKVHSKKGLGLVNEVFDEESLQELKGNLGVGHVRYSTAGASRAENALEVIFAFYKRKLNELGQINPLFFRDLRKYPNVLTYIREHQKLNDAAALVHFQKGVEEGIFRNDINFAIINQAMSMQMEMLIYSDITENYPISEIYSEVTFLHMRGITTPKGMQMVDAFLQSVKEKP